MEDDPKNWVDRYEHNYFSLSFIIQVQDFFFFVGVDPRVGHSYVFNPQNGMKTLYI